MLRDFPLDNYSNKLGISTLQVVGRIYPKIWVDAAGAEAREQAYGVFTLKLRVDVAEQF